MAEHKRERPALLGGPATVPEGPPEWPPGDPAVVQKLLACFHSGDWGRYHGRFTAELQERLGQAWDVRHVRLMCSGTAAVEAALRAVPVRPGDEVILAAYDFKANFTNIVQLGAMPVLVDVRATDWQIDPQRVCEAWTPRTRAVIVSHLHGGIAPVRTIAQWARARGVAVIEDACQCPGSLIDGRIAGTIGDIGVVSFGGSKTLSAGRGGAVLTNDDACAQRIRLWDERGNRACPLSELQAAVLLPQLEALPQRNRRRWRAARHLCCALQHIGALRPLVFESLRLRADDPECRDIATGTPPPAQQATASPDTAATTAMADDGEPHTVPGLYKLGFRFDPEAVGLSAELFVRAVRAEGVALDRGFAGLHRIHARRRFRAPHSLSNADRAHENALVLHHPVLLAERGQLDAVANAIEKVLDHAAAIHSAAEDGRI